MQAHAKRTCPYENSLNRSVTKQFAIYTVYKNWKRFRFVHDTDIVINTDFYFGFSFLWNIYMHHIKRRSHDKKCLLLLFSYLEFCWKHIFFTLQNAEYCILDKQIVNKAFIQFTGVRIKNGWQFQLMCFFLLSIL